MKQSWTIWSLHFSYLKLFWFVGAWKRAEESFPTAMMEVNSIVGRIAFGTPAHCTCNDINHTWIIVVINQLWQMYVFPSEIRSSIRLSTVNEQGGIFLASLKAIRNPVWDLRRFTGLPLQVAEKKKCLLIHSILKYIRIYSSCLFQMSLCAQGESLTLSIDCRGTKDNWFFKQPRFD